MTNIPTPLGYFFLSKLQEKAGGEDENRDVNDENQDCDNNES